MAVAWSGGRYNSHGHFDAIFAASRHGKVPVVLKETHLFCNQKFFYFLSRKVQNNKRFI